MSMPSLLQRHDDTDTCQISHAPIMRIIVICIAIAMAVTGFVWPSPAFASDTDVKRDDHNVFGTISEEAFEASKQTELVSTSSSMPKQMPDRVSGDDLATWAAEADGASVDDQGNTVTPDGVVGAYTPSNPNQMPKNERYSGWPVIGGLLNTLTSKDRTTGSMTFDKSDDVPQGGGATLEKIVVKWRGFDGETWERTVSGTADESFPIRVDFSVSGQYDIDKGAMEIVLPLSIFKARDGRDMGSISMSLPEDPTRGTVFAYKRIDDTIVVTNVQRLPAAYQGYFEMSFTGIDPVEVVSGSHSAPVGAVMTLVNHDDETLKLTSDTIDAVINTSVRVTNANKRGTLYRSWPDWDSSNVSLPVGFNRDDYYYVDWYTYARVEGNQYYTIDSIVDTPTFGGDYMGGLIVGGTGNGEVSEGGKSYTITKPFEGYRVGDNFYYHVYTAHPKSELSDGDGSIAGSGPVVRGRMRNSVTYTLTSLDTKQTSSASASASVDVREYPWTVPTGHFMLYKWGIGESGACQTIWPGTYNSDYNTCSRNIGSYSYAINQLAQHKDVDLKYDVVTTNYPYPWTYDGSGNPKDPANYNKRSIDVEVRDHDTYFHELTGVGDESLTTDDFEFTKLEVLDSQMWRYAGSVYSGWDYETTNQVARPDIELYAKSGDTSDWVKYGTAKWGDDGFGALTITPDNGASANGRVLTFPEGAKITDWKMNYSTNAAGIYTGVMPTMKLFSTDKTRAVAAELMANSDETGTDARNTATMDVTQTLDGKTDNLVTLTRFGVDRLSAAAQWANMSKSASASSLNNEDKAKRRTRVHFNSTVTLRSNQTIRDNYDEVVSSGIIASDTAGTFFDLLPKHMNLDTTSVKAPGVQLVRVVPNWRGSGRDMLIVKVKNAVTPTKIQAGNISYWGQQHSISYDAVFSWDDMEDYSILYSTNNIAYASDASFLGTVKGSMGEPDDPLVGNNWNSKSATQGVVDYMKDLVDNDNPSVLYASGGVSSTNETYGFSGLNKRVSTGGDWVTGLDLEFDGDKNVVEHPEDALGVYSGGVYKYRLHMRNDDKPAEGSRLTNIVLYDDLDAYVPTDDKPDHGKPQWQGTFVGLDVSQLEQMGVKPVVYYATKNVDLTQWKVDGSDAGIDGIPDLSDANVWSTSLPTDSSTVKAVAIDCSKAADGSAYNLPTGKALQAQITMHAPTGQVAQDYVKQNAHAYNNVYMSSTQIMANGQQADHYIHQDYTKIGLMPYTVDVSKTFDDDDNRDGIRATSIDVQLKRDGDIIGEPIILNADNGFKHRFEYLDYAKPDGTPYEYSVEELGEHPGYQVQINSKPIDGGLAIEVVNKHEIERVKVAGTKTWTDEGEGVSRPREVTLELLADGKKIQTKTVTADAAGNWMYDFGNLPKNVREDDKTRPIVYEVKETYTEGYVPAYTNKDGVYDITNRYNPYGDITLTKTASDTTSASADHEFMFELTLKKPTGTFGEDGKEIYDYDTGTYDWSRTDGAKGTIQNGGTVSLKAGQSVTVKRVPSRDIYTWTEQAKDGFTVGSSSGLTGTVTSGGNAQGTVENVYATTGAVQLGAFKVLTGHALGNRQFGFEVLALDRENEDATTGTVGALLRTASNKKDGTVTFSKIMYGNPDVDHTYVYVMHEVNTNRPGYTYDGSWYWVEVHVSDNGDGTSNAVPTYYHAEVADGESGAKTVTRGKKLEAGMTPVFTNVYKASGQLDLTASKVFSGGDLKKKQFTFELLDANTNEVIATATTGDNGEARFTPIKYNESDAGKSYRYTMRERIDEHDRSVVWDEHSETIEVTVTDNNDGTLKVEPVFSGGVEGEPLVWRNAAADGSLRIEKHLTSDATTRSKKDTVFPVEVSIVVPKGSHEFKNGTAKVYTPKWRDGDGEGGQWPDANWFKDTANYEMKEVRFTVSDDGRFKVGVPAEGYVIIDGLPGGTSYAAAEVGSLD